MPVEGRDTGQLRSGGPEGMELSRPEGPGRMPVLFVGHGSPLNAIELNRWSAAFRALAGLLPRPRAVLAVSAHWYVGGIFTTGNHALRIRAASPVVAGISAGGLAVAVRLRIIGGEVSAGWADRQPSEIARALADARAVMNGLATMGKWSPDLEKQAA